MCTVCTARIHVFLCVTQIIYSVQQKYLCVCYMCVCRFAMQSQNPRSQLENSNFDTFWADWLGWLVWFANCRFCKWSVLQMHATAYHRPRPIDSFVQARAWFPGSTLKKNTSNRLADDLSPQLNGQPQVMSNVAFYFDQRVMDQASLSEEQRIW